MHRDSRRRNFRVCKQWIRAMSNFCFDRQKVNIVVYDTAQNGKILIWSRGQQCYDLLQKHRLNKLNGFFCLCSNGEKTVTVPKWR